MNTVIAPKPSVAPSALNPRYKWWVVLMLWFICFFNYADRQSIYSVFPRFKEVFDFDKVQLGLIGSSFMWVYAFGAPIAGFIGDRVRRKDLVLGGCVFWSCITVLTGWCGKLWQFVVVRALEGLGETFYYPASMSLIGDYHGRATRSRAMAFHQSSVYLGTVAGSWAGGWFAERMRWQNCFFLSGAAGAVLGLVLFKFLREPPRGRSETANAGLLPEPTLPVGETLRAVFRTPTAYFIVAAFVCANFVATIFLVWTPTFLAEKFGFKFAAAGLSGAVFIHLASAVSVVAAGYMADKLAHRFAGGRIMTQAFGLLVGSIFVFIVGTTSNVTTLLITMTCFGLCKGFYDANIFASLYDVVEPRARATAAGIMNAIGWGAGGLGPVVLGWFSKHGRESTESGNMSDALACCGVVYFVGALILFTSIFIFARRDIPCGQIQS